MTAGILHPTNRLAVQPACCCLPAQLGCLHGFCWNTWCGPSPSTCCGVACQCANCAAASPSCRGARLPTPPAHPPTCCRSETYQYFNLPFCHPKEGKEYKPEGLGEVLEGDRLVSTPYKIK